MSYKWKAVPAIALLALIAATPAYATVTLNFVPQNSVIPTIGNTTNVEIRADFTQAVVGWGLDLNVANPGVADMTGFTIGPAWDPQLASIDGVLLGGTSLVDVGPGTNILLATLTFQAFGNGVTPISLSANDIDEGFLLNDFVTFDSVNFANGTVTVPEPATLVLVALGGLLVQRRTRWH